MNTVAVIFWIGIFIVFYTYIGYGIILYLLVKVKEMFRKPVVPELPGDLPHVTLFIAAYNEELVIKEKMKNCRQLDYPADKLEIIWVTDGSDDHTNQLLSRYPEVTVYFQPERKGKAAAFNRGVPYVTTPFLVFTDANTMLNPDAIREMIRPFGDPKVGCVAGEKRVSTQPPQAAVSTEGVYWMYESKLKELDYRLYSAIGAAGELFAIRRELYTELRADTLLDDFILSMQIAMQGYKIAYTKFGYALENASINMVEESKRKTRIAAGGQQAIWRLRGLLNVFRYGVLSWQYVSHRVLRWSLAPIFLFALLPLNIALVVLAPHAVVYWVFLILQGIFYLTACWGYMLANRKLKNRVLFIPYYFLFMNLNVINGMNYLWKNRGKGTWEKAKRG